MLDSAVGARAAATIATGRLGYQDSHQPRPNVALKGDDVIKTNNDVTKAHLRAAAFGLIKGAARILLTTLNTDPNVIQYVPQSS